MLELMDSLGLEQDMVRIVMNRDTPGSELQLKEIEDALEQEIIGGLPSDGQAVMPSIDEGIPVVLSQPDCEFTVQLRELTRNIIIDELELEEELLEYEEPGAESSTSGAPADQLIAPSRRILSGLIDYLIGGGAWLLIVLISVGIGLNAPAPTGVVVGILLGALGLVVPLGYLSYFHTTSQTIGERVIGAQLVNEDGNRPGFQSVLVRTLLEMALFGISHLFMFFGTSNQALHDRMAGTFVVAHGVSRTE